MVDLIAEGKNVSTVLFLCIGNYYRLPKNCSIMSGRAGLYWTAQSRGFALERGTP